MKDLSRPIPIKNAPLQYAPEGEMGVVFLFATMAKKLQFRIEKIRAAYPDCIAYRHVGDSEKRVRIEFEYRSRSFKLPPASFQRSQSPAKANNSPSFTSKQ